MIYRPPRSRRRSATIVETTIVLLVFLALILGMADLVAAVFRYNGVSEGAREGARQAIVHGALSSSSWGPTANDSNAVSSITTSVNNLGLSNPTVSVQWPDGDNQAGSRVSVTVTASYRPLTTFVFGSPTWTLTATSIMPIAH